MSQLGAACVFLILAFAAAGCCCPPEPEIVVSPDPDPDPTVDYDDTESAPTVVLGSSTTKSHQLSVVRFKDANTGAPAGEVLFTKTEATDTFKAMRDLLFEDHDGDAGSGDVSCDVAFVLKGTDVGIFDDDADGYIYTKADWIRVMRLEGCIKVMKGIYYCGGVTKPKECDVAATVYGCAQSPSSLLHPGRKFAVRRQKIDTDLFSRIWSHEFGHTQGIGHSSDGDEVMHSPITVSTEMVTEAQCKDFEATRPTAACDKELGDVAQATDSVDAATCATGGGG